MSRFVRPETTVLHISEGDTLTVKRRLTSGEQRDAYTRMYRAGLDGALRVNPLQTGLAMMTAYLIDWSLVDDDDAKVDIKGLPVDELERVLNSLDPDSFSEIRIAIETHEEAMRAERDEQKKTRAGKRNDVAISSSPFDAAGVLIGSAN